jgi:hypothetical protein
VSDWTWREISRPIIEDVIRTVGKDDPKALRKAISAAYPFGERRYWPYKAWLAEVKAQIGGMRPRPHSRDLFDEDTTHG